MLGFFDDDDDADAQTDTDPGDQGEQQSAESRDRPDPDQQSLTGDQYDIAIEEREKAGTHEVRVETASHGPVAGRKVRRMFERAHRKPDRPIWVGYDDTARNGWREAPIRFKALKAHMWISGTTGAGKTTTLRNKAIQHAYAGHGFCNIDPKASGDTLELLQTLPKHRLDDVILIEPGSPEFEQVVGINMLDMPAIEDDNRREKEIESRLENLVAIFDNDEYWGVNMQAVTESMGRAMLRHNAEVSLDPERDASEKYSVIDMYFILLNAERREQFAEEVDDVYLKEFLFEIAEMDDDDLRPLTKRIKSWVENAVVRKIIARRESTIDWDDIVDNDRILLVRIPVDSEDIHQMISLTVLRNLWSAKKRQDRSPERETEPYFLQVDEFEKVANDNLAVEDMLARARSMWLSVTLGTQYPFQIEKDHEGTMRAMQNNCNTLLAMRTPGGDDARILMERFEGYSAGDLMDTDFYRTWTKIPLEGGRESDPVNLMGFAPYPPLRSEEAAKDAIRENMDEFGATPLTDAEIQRELKYGEYNEAVDPAAAPGADINPDAAALDSGEVSVEDLPVEAIMEGIYAAQVQEADEETLVSVSRAKAEIEKRLGSTGYESQLSNVFEETAEIKMDRRSGEQAVGLTSQGRNRVLSADTGSSASGGKGDHRWVLQQSFKAFTKLGALTRLPTQEGDELPDGVADLPIDPLAEADSVQEVHELEAQLQDDYERLYALSEGRHISIEAETSTISKPSKTLTNLRKAIESDRLCVFTCKDATAKGKGLTYWPWRGEKLIYDTDGGEVNYDEITCVKEVDEAGNRTFYNGETNIPVDGDGVAVRPQADDSLTWHEDGDAVVATAGDGSEVARFDDIDGLADASPEEVGAYRTLNDQEQWVVKTGTETHGPYGTLTELREDWQELITPFIPEREFPRAPTDDDFVFVVFPDNDNEEYDEPVLYEQGEQRCLWDVGHEEPKDEPAGNDDSTPSEEPSKPVDNCDSPTGEEVIEAAVEETVDEPEPSTNGSEVEAGVDDNGADSSPEEPDSESRDTTASSEDEDDKTTTDATDKSDGDEGQDEDDKYSSGVMDLID